VLPSLSHSASSLDQAAHKVNESLSNLILSVPQTAPVPPPAAAKNAISARVGSFSGGSANSTEDKDSATGPKETQNESPNEPFDYYATVNSLTLQFLNEHEETRAAAFDWLIMLHRKAPNKVWPLHFHKIDNRFSQSMMGLFRFF
jgi:vacuole morphology and inheritance protein 14